MQRHNLNDHFRKIVGLVSHLMNAYCFLQFFDGLVVSSQAKSIRSMMPKASQLCQL